MGISGSSVLLTAAPRAPLTKLFVNPDPFTVLFQDNATAPKCFEIIFEGAHNLLLIDGKLMHPNLRTNSSCDVAKMLVVSEVDDLSHSRHLCQ